MHKLCRKVNKTCKIFGFFKKTIDKTENKAYTVSNNSKGAVSFTGLQRLFVYFTLYFIWIGENTYGKCTRDVRQHGF